MIFYDKNKNRWVTVTSPKELLDSDGQKIRREDVKRAMYLPGDGGLSRASALWQNLEGVRVQSPYKTIHRLCKPFLGAGDMGVFREI